MMKYVLTQLVIVFLFSCGDDNIQVQPPGCEDQVVINEERYQSDKSDAFTITSTSITDNCLNIEISSSGCDGERWTTTLLDGNLIAESSPEQRYIRLLLSNDEECDAVIQRSYNFDISDLQIQNNGGALILHLSDHEEPLMYEY